MSPLRSAFVRAASCAFAVSSLLLVVGCDARPAPEVSDSVLAPPTPVAPADSSEYAVVAGSRPKAQQILSAAEASFLEAPRGHYIVTWSRESGEAHTMVTAEFDAEVPAGRQVLLPNNDEGHVEMLLIEADSWSRPTVDGETAECWMHFSRGATELARVSAFLPGAYPLIEPVAVGLLEQGSQNEVVVDLLLDEALPIAAQKVANQLRSPIDPEARIPAVMTIADGEYASLRYDMAHVVSELEREQPLPPGVRESLDIANGWWTVRVDYSDLGAEVAVVPPPGELVADMGNPDALATDGPLPTCEAA